MKSKDLSKRVLAATLTSLFILQQSSLIGAFASDISGFNQTSGTFNIDPTAIITNTDIGYRKYENFNLSEGDVANLIFKYGGQDINTFMNLVDNQIIVNGLVNSMRNGNFYNGKAIFVSPNGMVVGASGVLNVGSLAVYTPTNSVYNDYKGNPRADLNVLTNSNNNSTVTVNGKVIATENIDVYSGQINVPGKMLAGTGNNQVVTGRQRAEELFNSIVNTTNIHQASSMVSRNGKITLTSSIGTNISGDIANYGNGSINITNNGKNGIKISGNSSNYYGNTNITNNAGGINVTGKIVNNNGNARITNKGTEGLNIEKNAIVDGTNSSIYLTNTGEQGLNISGKVTTNKSPL